MHDTGCIDDEAQHDGVEPWRSSGFAGDRLLSDAELDRNREPNEGQTASGVCRFGHDELAQHIATWPGVTAEAEEEVDWSDNRSGVCNPGGGGGAC